MQLDVARQVERYLQLGTNQNAASPHKNYFLTKITMAIMATIPNVRFKKCT